FQRISLLKGFTSSDGTAIALAKVEQGYDIVEVSREAAGAIDGLQQDALKIGFLSYGSSIDVFNRITKRDVRIFAPFTAILGVLVLIWLFRIRERRGFLLISALLLAVVVLSLAPYLPPTVETGLILASGLLLLAAIASMIGSRFHIRRGAACCAPTASRFMREGIFILLVLLGLLLWRRDGLVLGIIALAGAAYSFKRLSDLYLPILVVVLAAAWTFGLLGVFGVPLNFLMVAVLPLLLGVGIDDSIHILHRYEGERRAGEDGRRAIRTAITRTGRALLLTTVTTIVGFSSLTLSRSPPIQRFGLLASFAMATSFVITMALIPATKNLLREGASAGPGERETRLGHGLRRHVAAIERPRVAALVLVVVLLLGGGAFWFGRNLELYAFDLRRMLPPNFPIVKLYNEINEEFRIYDEADILIEGDIPRLEVMRAMVESAPMALSRSPYIRRVTSIAQFLDDTRRANPVLEGEFMEKFFQEGPDAAYRFLLDYVFSRPDLRAQAEGYVYRDEAGAYTGAVIRADVLRYHEYQRARRVAEDVTARVAPLVRELEGLGLVVQVTGSPFLTEISLRTLREGFFESMGLAFLLCFGVIALALRSTLWGLVSVVPIALVMGLELGTIKLLGIKINASTAMVAAISIGLGVDYAIHLVQRFREERDLGWATSRTGEALFGSCSTTIAAFFALILGEILWNRDFGLLAGTAILYAFIVTVLVLPALLALISRLKIVRGD
ncbi:MAG: RND family transporter, partial [Candidatus Bipolaricaulia bacterium]